MSKFCKICNSKLDIFGDCDNCAKIAAAAKAKIAAESKKAAIVSDYKSSNAYDDGDIIASLARKYNLPKSIILEICGCDESVEIPEQFCSCGRSLGWFSADGKSADEMTCNFCKEENKAKAKKLEDEQKAAPAIAWINEQEASGLICKLPEFGDMPAKFEPAMGPDKFAVVYKKDGGLAEFARNEDGNLYSFGGGVNLAVRVRNCPDAIINEVKKELIRRSK